MLAKIGVYLLFLCTLAAYVALLSYVQKKQINLLTDRRTNLFLLTQLQVVVSMIVIVLIPWVLTRSVSAHFCILSLAAYEGSALLGQFLFFCLRVDQRLVGVKSAMSYMERLQKHPLAFGISTAVFGLLVLLGYFIAATYVYFSNPMYSQDAIRQVFKLNLLLLLLGTCLVFAVIIPQIVSRHTDGRTRQALFFNLLMSGLSTGIFLTVFLEITGIGQAQRGLTVSGLKVDFLYLPTLGTIAVFVVVLILPYFIGLTERRRYEIDVYKQMMNWINKVIKILNLPSLQDSAQLAQLRDEIATFENGFVESELILRISAGASSGAREGDQVESQMRSMLEAHGELKEDLRFVYLQFLHDLTSRIAEIKTEYDCAPSDGDSLKKIAALAPAYVNSFQVERQEHEKMIEQVESRKVIAFVLKTVIPTLGAALTAIEYGQRLAKFLPLGH